MDISAPSRLFDETEKVTDCSAYLAFRNHDSKSEMRALLEKQWCQLAPVCGEPRDFVRRFRGTEFTSRLWELYLAAMLVGTGNTMNTGQHSRKKGGPDFLVRSPTAFYIEAVAARPGEQGNLPYRIPAPCGTRIVVGAEQAALCRITNALTQKANRVKNYKRDRVTVGDVPVVIALSLAAINNVDLHSPKFMLPLILKALFAVEGPKMVVPVRQPRSQSTMEYNHRSSIEKDNGSTVRTDWFLTRDWSHVAAVLFSDCHQWSLPRQPPEHLLLLHNPNADDPLPEGTLPVGQEWLLDGRTLRKAEPRPPVP